MGHLLGERELVAGLRDLDRQKSDFVATASHELRTPLTSISGYLEMLEDGDLGELSSRQHSAVAVLSRNVGRLRGLIEDLLILNRLDSGKGRAVHEEVNLPRSAVEVIPSLDPIAAKKGVELIGPGPCPPQLGQAEADQRGEALCVIGDRDQLERALTNVVGNAVKFTPAGRRVTISLGGDAARVEFVCEDSGIGIPETDMESLFTRFFRASNAVEQQVQGSGLGLSIVLAIVEGGTRARWTSARWRARALGWRSACRSPARRSNTETTPLWEGEMRPRRRRGGTPAVEVIGPSSWGSSSRSCSSRGPGDTPWRRATRSSRFGADLSDVLNERYGPVIGTAFLVGFWAASFSSIIGVWNGVSLMLLLLLGKPIALHGLLNGRRVPKEWANGLPTNLTLGVTALSFLALGGTGLRRAIQNGREPRRPSRAKTWSWQQRDGPWSSCARPAGRPSHGRCWERLTAQAGVPAKSMPAWLISSIAAEVDSGATPATRSSSTVVPNPSRTASSAVARTQ
ncbi:MAG: ATP-binding protein [Ornithinimicrobium sp.]|uniref:sensor histidine kinase n=1 Tax=Ornithinimicrobium sp. TaxID=1977084 RepID=UPI003D9B70AC